MWLPPSRSPHHDSVGNSCSKPHLTLSLWLYCGSAGMKVWLPLFPKDDDSRHHTFMARRIMLHFPLHNIYPLCILFKQAIIVGVENDTQLMTSSLASSSGSSNQV